MYIYIYVFVSFPCIYVHFFVIYLALPAVNPKYECKKHGQCYHSVFGSYRVDPDAVSMEILTNSIEASRSSARKFLTMFWDRNCLPFAKNWEEGFVNCLRNSGVILLLVSPEAVERCQSADRIADNFLLEMDIATELHAAQKATVIPIFMIDKNYSGDHDTFLHFLKTGFPDKTPIHPWAQKTISSTMYAVAQLPGAHRIRRGDDFTSLAEAIANLCLPSKYLPIFILI